MSYSIKLLVPIGLGLLAAAINWGTLYSGTRPVNFVQVSKPLRVGDIFRGDVLASVALPATYSKLDRTAVLWEDRGILSGQIVQRDLEPGDIVFLRDTSIDGAQLRLREGETAFLVSLHGVNPSPALLRVEHLVRFRIPAVEEHPQPEWVGPFRLVSVGSTLTDGIDRKSGNQSIDQVTIAFPPEATRSPQEKRDCELMQKFCDMQGSSGVGIGLLGIEFLGPSR